MDHFALFVCISVAFMSALFMNLTEIYLADIHFSTMMIVASFVGVVAPPLLGLLVPEMNGNLFHANVDDNGNYLLIAGTTCSCEPWDFPDSEFPASCLSFAGVLLLFAAVSFGGALVTSVMATCEIIISFLIQVLIFEQPIHWIAVCGSVLVITCIVLLVLEQPVKNNCLCPRRLQESFLADKDEESVTGRAYFPENDEKRDIAEKNSLIAS